jgi:hypothetical protein
MDKLTNRRHHQVIVTGMICATILLSVGFIWGVDLAKTYIEYKKNKQDIEYSERAKKAIERQKEQQ